MVSHPGIQVYLHSVWTGMLKIPHYRIRGINPQTCRLQEGDLNPQDRRGRGSPLSMTIVSTKNQAHQ